MMNCPIQDKVKVNRIGYLPEDHKTVFFRMDAPETSHPFYWAGFRYSGMPD